MADRLMRWCLGIGLIRIVSVVGPTLAGGRFFCQDISIHLFSILFLSGEPPE
jgi:hypothetical protein